MRGQIDNLTNAFRQVQAGIALEQDKSDFNRIIGTANKESSKRRCGERKRRTMASRIDGTLAALVFLFILTLLLRP